MIAHDVGAGADLDAEATRRRRCERRPQRVEPAARVPAAEARLEVRDAGQRGRRPERRRPGVRGVAPGPLHEPRIGEVRPRPQRCSVRSGSMPARSAGERIRRSSCQRPAHRAGEERPRADVPDPPAVLVEAPPRRAGAGREAPRTRRPSSSASSGTTSDGTVGPVVAELRVEADEVDLGGQRRAGRRRNSSSNTCGRVSSDGPTSNVNPSWRRAASLPPVTCRCARARRPGDRRRRGGSPPPARRRRRR